MLWIFLVSFGCGGVKHMSDICWFVACCDSYNVLLCRVHVQVRFFGDETNFPSFLLLTHCLLAFFARYRFS